MELRPGVRLGLAPRFHSALPWVDRLQINGGVVGDRPPFRPRGDWRPLREAELALLLADDAEGDCSAGPCAWLVNLPAHLRRRWWASADVGAAPAGEGPPYRAFAEDVVEFLRFKGAPLPARCRVEAAVSRPGQRSTRWDAAAGAPGGLDFNGGDADRVVGAINLGEEPTHLVLLNLGPAAMAEALAPAAPAGAGPSAALLGSFFARRARYPLIRVRLEAGDGLWLPAGIVYDGCTVDKREVDVVLNIRGGAVSG